MILSKSFIPSFQSSGKLWKLEMDRMHEPDDRGRAVKYHPLDMTQWIYSELIPTAISRPAQDRTSQQSVTDGGQGGGS